MSTEGTDNPHEASFGHLITAILQEKNVQILSKYKKQLSKYDEEMKRKHDEQRAAKKRERERREMMNECHVTPDIVYNAKQERIMRKTATYGVVALFKAVAKHQRDLKRSLNDIDSDDDVLQRKTMRIEQQSTHRLLSSLNESSSKSSKNALIETPNPIKHKRRKLMSKHEESSALPPHLQSILVDKQKRKNSKNANESESEFNEEELDSDSFDDDDTVKGKQQWSVLDEDMMLHSHKSKQQTMEEDSEFDDDSD